ncbi:rhodanese-like domain-containing protein [Novosphingobium sp.]|uniref:rhodanese-like domain-containing protein n=1 Tax=Novosphingobium sp. TaxID=1874826 RepID=UPI0025E608DC|nr:rhodanese-like domain-containing protein [Novosphingobium sp.]MCC6926704.1 rhodanese-like domain-containing protein [Novosphingobium sp.]
MIFGFGRKQHRELTPRQLDSMIQQGRALVVDVREADEFAAGHIPGAINVPLSVFRASQLPDPGDKTLILNCAAGRRSAMALDKCAAARAEIDTHLAGGFGAWRAAGLPVAI